MRLEVDDVWCYVVGDTGTLGIIDSVTSYLSDTRFFSPKFKKGFWDGRVRMREYDRSRKQYRFPTGFVERVIAAMDAVGHSYEIVDNRCLMVPDIVTVMADGTQLRPYQIEKMVEPALAKGRGVIKAVTGAGKTVCAAALIASYGCPTLWLTDRRQLMYQTQRALSRYFQKPIGLLGDEVKDIQDVTVAMVQTLDSIWKTDSSKIKEIVSQIQLLILDEAHHAQAESWFKIIQSCPAPYRIGVSATPGSMDSGDGMRLLGVTGEQISEVTATELIDLGYLIAPSIYFVDYETPKLGRGLDWRAVFKQGILENEGRNKAILDVAWEWQIQERCALTLVQQVAHGQNLTKMYTRAGIRAKHLQGKCTQLERDDMIGSLQDHRLDHLVASVQIVGEGFDLPIVSGVLNALGTKGGGSKSKGVQNENGKVTIQAIGRGLRPAAGKSDFIYVDMNDTSHKMLVSATTDRANALVEEGYAKYIHRWSDRPNARSI